MRVASRRNLKDGRHGAKVSRRTVVAVDDADVADSRALPATRRVWVSFLEMRAAGESQGNSTPLPVVLREWSPLDYLPPPRDGARNWLIGSSINASQE